MMKLSYSEKMQMIKIAKDLGYSSETIAKIRKAKTETEVDRAMITARKNGEIGSTCWR